MFPRGILIGKVSQVETVPADGSLRVLVTHEVDFSSVEEIFVVLEVREEPPVEDADADDAGALALPREPPSNERM